MNTHNYDVYLKWTGNLGKGTTSYRSYKREYVIKVEGKPDLPGSSDPAFRGDKSLHNPEELFIASISSCHMLWYLHLSSNQDITVVDYQDKVSGVMIEENDGGGYFESVTLMPIVVIAQSDKISVAQELHQMANEKCFIANSCNFKIYHKPVTRVHKKEGQYWI